MYFMNVPPFGATHTEWRTCGPSQGYSLFDYNNSDSELSTSDSNIQDKVQMIIKSLTSTQSSLDMGDEVEGNVPGQDVYPEVCKIGMDPLVGSKSTCSTEHREMDISSSINCESQDSDSDDSVDRGIEEAILEYLKEKDGHKRKAEPSTIILQSSKVHRKNTHIPEITKQHSDSIKVLIASNQLPKCSKVETPMGPTILSLTNNLQNKVPCKENPVQKMDIGKGTAENCIFPKEQTKCFSKTNNPINKVTCHAMLTVEKDSPESSSDDGIEEAIQRYQLEKNNRSDNTCKSFMLIEPSDSSSDDGIEEAIRCYQLEQLKETSVLKPFLHKERPKKSSINPIDGSSIENVKKKKKKKKRTDKDINSVFPSLSSVRIPQGKFICNPRGNVNGVLPSKEDPLREQQTPATLKVNTSAELMCAEAILDISKAVMPGAFTANVGLSSFNSNQATSVPSTCLDDGSNDSSIDSEDGIEQEIRKFLEQKAQMHKQPTSSAAITAEPGSLNELDILKGKHETTQKRDIRLSLTQKRKFKLENCEDPVIHHKATEELALKTIPEHKNELKLFVSPQTGPTPPSAGSENIEQGGDKSSSLDSDEDLDTAIKDLLKTKKKLKKKTRDLKLKTRKCLNNEDDFNTLQTKRPKLDGFSKRSVLNKDKPTLNKRSMLPEKQCDKIKEQTVEMDTLEGTRGGAVIPLHSSEDIVGEKEESSSIDSDDSIEQEIRRFLAEKAKVPTIDKAKDEDVQRNGNMDVCTQFPEKVIKLENQLVEISRQANTLLLDESLLSSPDKVSQDGKTVENSACTLTVSATCHRPVLSYSPALLEPADGAGTACIAERRPNTGTSTANDPSFGTARTLLPSSSSVHQFCSDAMKWRQSLGLPTTDTRAFCPVQSSFQTNSPKVGQTAATTAAHRVGTNPKTQIPSSSWSSTRSGWLVAPSRHSPETPVNSFSTTSHHASSSRQSSERSRTKDLATGGHGEVDPVSGQTDSVVHLAKDQSVFIKLTSERTNNIQVQSRDVREASNGEDLPSRKSKERECMITDEKPVQQRRTEEEFVDESDCELDERRSPEKMQGFGSMFLSSEIDPGISLRPYIYLTTAERNCQFMRRCKQVNCAKIKTLKYFKRKLKFVLVPNRGSTK